MVKDLENNRMANLVMMDSINTFHGEDDQSSKWHLCDHDNGGIFFALYVL